MKKSRLNENGECMCPMCVVYRFLKSQKDNKEALDAYNKIIARAEEDSTDLWSLRHKAQTENAFWLEGKFWRQVHN